MLRLQLKIRPLLLFWLRHHLHRVTLVRIVSVIHIFMVAQFKVNFLVVCNAKKLSKPLILFGICLFGNGGILLEVHFLAVVISLLLLGFITFNSL